MSGIGRVARPWRLSHEEIAGGSAELLRLEHALLPRFTSAVAGAAGLELGPAPLPPAPLPSAGAEGVRRSYLARFLGLSAFLSSRGLGVSTGGVLSAGVRPGTADVPWLASPPVPRWRAVPPALAAAALTVRLDGKELEAEDAASLAGAVEGALARTSAGAARDGLGYLRAHERGTRAEALLAALLERDGLPARITRDFLGLVYPSSFRDLPQPGGPSAAAWGPAAHYVARGAARREPGVAGFVEIDAVTPAGLGALARRLGSDPRAAAVDAIAAGRLATLPPGPPLSLLVEGRAGWEGSCREAWARLGGEGIVRLEVRAEQPPPWEAVAPLRPLLGRDEMAGLAFLPFPSLGASVAFWEDLSRAAAGDAARFLSAADAAARGFRPGGAADPAPRSRRPARTRDPVLRAAALLAPGFAAAEAAEAAGVPAARAEAALRAGAAAGALGEEAGRYRFVDEGARTALVGAASADERRDVVERLERAGIAGPRLVVAALSRAAEADVCAARALFSSLLPGGDPALARSLLSRAPEGDPDLGDPLAAAATWFAFGERDRARRSARRVEPGELLSRPLEEREAGARLLARLGEEERALALLPGAGSPSEVLARAQLLARIRRADDAERLLGGLEPVEPADRVRYHLVAAELAQGRQQLGVAEAALECLSSLLPVAGEDPWRGDAAFLAGWIANDLGRSVEAMAFFRRAAEEAETPARRADALFDLASAASDAGRGEVAGQALEEALALFAGTGERERYLSALGLRAEIAFREGDAAAARRDVARVLEHDREPGRDHQLLLTVPLWQRLALADGDLSEAREAFEEAVRREALFAAHPARREILVLEALRVLVAGRAIDSLALCETARPLPDARTRVEPLRLRLEASARLHLGRSDPDAPKLPPSERELLEAEARLARGAAPEARLLSRAVREARTARGALPWAARLVEWRLRFPAFFGSGEAAPFREAGARAARRAGLAGAESLLSAPPPPSGTPPAPAVPAGLVAEDERTQEAFDLAARLAPLAMPVLVLGETGTGKELVARALHRLSGRTGPFVALNVAALTETLVDSELFGHARGAFTGADRDRAGVFEAASGGTLFLDEIGELSPVAQAKLLRVLQEKEVRRVGETRTRKVDVRVVAATHRDLAARVEEGAFRQDLYYRIAGMTVTLEPLRKRPRDLARLIDLALAGASLTPQAREALLSHRWPGNVRELFGVLEAARALAAPSGRIGVSHLRPALRSTLPSPAARDDGADGPDGSRAVASWVSGIEERKTRMIVDALEAEGGNRTRAARRLGISRQTLVLEIRKRGLSREVRPATLGRCGERGGKRERPDGS